MQLQALGYVGIRASDLDEWANYATRFLGMQLVEKSREALALRMDDRKSASSSMALRTTVRPFTAGKSPTQQRSTRWARTWKNPQ